MWAITATVRRNVPGPGEVNQEFRQVPTFYLDERVQGVRDTEHAALIAKEVIDPFDLYLVHVHAVKVS